MRKKITAMVVLVALLLSMVSTGALAKNNVTNVNVKINQDGSVQVGMKFNDLKEAAWAMKNILKMNAQNIIMGYDDGNFRPNKPVTHAEAVVLTMRAAGLQSEIDNQVASSVYLPFKDAKTIPVWARKAVALAVAKGYVQAGPSISFQPNKAANRQWVVQLIAKALNLQPVAIQLPFTDASKISPEAAGYVAAVVYKQLISGFPDGSFQPNKPVTRAEIAVMLGISTNEMPIPAQFKLKVEGTIKSVSLDSAAQVYDNVSNAVYSQGSITMDVEKDDDEDNSGQVTVTYPVAANAIIYVNEQAAKLSDVAVGAKAEAVIKNGMVTYLEVVPVTVRGVVQAVYNDTLTVINGKWGSKNWDLEPVQTTYTLAANATVTLNGKTAQAADLKAGDIVKLTLNAEQKVSSVKAARFVMRVDQKKVEKVKDAVEKAKETIEKVQEKVENVIEKVMEKVKEGEQKAGEHQGKKK